MRLPVPCQCDQMRPYTATSKGIRRPFLVTPPIAKISRVKKSFFPARTEEAQQLCFHSVSSFAGLVPDGSFSALAPSTLLFFFRLLLLSPFLNGEDRRFLLLLFLAQSSDEDVDPSLPAAPAPPAPAAPPPPFFLAGLWRSSSRCSFKSWAS